MDCVSSVCYVLRSCSSPSIEVSKLGTDLAYKYGMNRCGWSYGISVVVFFIPFRLGMSD